MVNRPASYERRLIIASTLPLQDGRCWWHGGKLEDATGDMAIPTVEHLLPRGAGGTNQAMNLVVSCKRCNHLRGCDQSWVMHPLLRGTLRARVTRATELWDLRHAVLQGRLISAGSTVGPMQDEHIIAWWLWAHANAMTDPRAEAVLARVMQSSAAGIMASRVLERTAAA